MKTKSLNQLEKEMKKINNPIAIKGGMNKTELIEAIAKKAKKDN